VSSVAEAVASEHAPSAKAAAVTPAPSQAFVTAFSSCARRLAIRPRELLAHRDHQPFDLV
jgi:hypothetical protein